MLIFLCDFDGTIVKSDIAALALNLFSDIDWKKYDIEFEKGLISLAEAMKFQYGSLKTSPQQIIDKIEESGIEIREGFDEFVNFCKTNNLSINIVSAGLDFLIYHVLKKYKWQDLQVISAKTSWSSTGINLEFPKFFNESSKDFKVDSVTYYQKLGYTVVFIGDGLSDRSAVRVANFSFIIKNSELSLLLNHENIDYNEFNNFNEIILHIEKNNLLNS